MLVGETTGIPKVGASVNRVPASSCPFGAPTPTSWRAMVISAPPAEEEEGQERVLPMPRLWRDAQALIELTNTDNPPRQRYRGKKIILAFYMPGDASGAWFGSAFIGDDGLLYEAGTWSGDWRAESSNFREADNLVTRVEALILDGAIVGHELFT